MGKNVLNLNEEKRQEVLETVEEETGVPTTWQEPDYVLAPDECVSVESAIRSVASGRTLSAVFAVAPVGPRGAPGSPGPALADLLEQTATEVRFRHNVLGELTLPVDQVTVLPALRGDAQAGLVQSGGHGAILSTARIIQRDPG